MRENLRGWSRSAPMRTGVAGGFNFQKELPNPGVYTIQFNVTGPSTRTVGGNTVRRRVYALVTWSVSGNAVERLMSIIDGASISGVAETIDCRVFDASVALAGTVAGAAYDYNVSAQVSEGQRPNVQQPAVLDLFTSPLIVPAGNFDSFDIAGAVAALGASGTGGIIAQFTQAGVTSANNIDPAIAASNVPPGIISFDQQAGSVLLTTSDPREDAWCPIVPGTDTLIYTVGAASPSSFAFYTVFGIDG